MIKTTDNSLMTTKLYNIKQIGIATFIGGPLAAGYLVSENYKALHKPLSAKKALLLGIISTIVLFVAIFSTPEEIIDKVPSVIIPAIYTGVVYFLVHKYQGEALEEHKKSNGLFFSIWRVIAIGVISLAIIVLGIFSYAYFTTDNEAYEKYDLNMEVFYDNEEEALKFYENLDSKSDRMLLEEVTNTMIPKWEENIRITEKMTGSNNLPSDLVKQNKALLEYSKLRLELAVLIKESISEKTDNRYQIDDISQKIDSVLISIKY